MNITQIVPAELSGFCDVATGECIVVDATPPADADSPHGRPVRPEETDKRPAPAARNCYGSTPGGPGLAPALR
jgi:hypothetical protein